MNKSKIEKWQGECVRKKKLRQSWADNVIARAAANNDKLYKYYCPHCQHWHVTKMNNYKKMD